MYVTMIMFTVNKLPEKWHGDTQHAILIRGKEPSC